MDKNRLWTIGIAGLIVIVGALGWSLGISPLVAQATAANEQHTSVSASNDASEARVKTLRQEFANIDTLQAQLSKLGESVPADPEIAVFLREINALTAQNKVTLGTVTVNKAAAYVPIVPVVAPVTTVPGGATPTPTASPSAGATGTTPAVAPVPVGPGTRLALVPLKLRVTGTYDEVLAFVGGLQNGPRLYLVNDLTVQASSAVPGKFDADISGSVYVLPSTSPATSLASSTTPSR